LYDPLMGGMVGAVNSTTVALRHVGAEQQSHPVPGPHVPDRARGRRCRPQDIELTVRECSPVLRHGRNAAFAVAYNSDERLVVVTEISRQADRIHAGELAATIRAAVAAEHCLQVHTVVLLPSGALPETSSGQVQRHRCAVLYERGRLPELSRSVLTPMTGDAQRPLGRPALLALPPAVRRDLLREYLCRLIASSCQVAEADLGDAPLSALGTDTYAMINIRYSVKTDLGVHLCLADISRAASPAGLAARVDELLAVTTGPLPPEGPHIVRQYSWSRHGLIVFMRRAQSVLTVLEMDGFHQMYLNAGFRYSQAHCSGFSCHHSVPPHQRLFVVRDARGCARRRRMSVRNELAR